MLPAFRNNLSVPSSSSPRTVKVSLHNHCKSLKSHFRTICLFFVVDSHLKYATSSRAELLLPNFDKVFPVLWLRKMWQAVTLFKCACCCRKLLTIPTLFQHTHIYPVYWHSAFSRACEKPVICHIVKKYPAFYGTWYFVTYYKTACHSSQCIAKLIPSTPFILISLRLNTIFSSHLYQFFPSDIMPLESNLPCTQEISFSMCTQFLSLCSEENTLVSIQTELVLIHTVRHISGRLIII